jgi:hypothetical protein
MDVLEYDGSAQPCRVRMRFVYNLNGRQCRTEGIRVRFARGDVARNVEPEGTGRFMFTERACEYYFFFRVHVAIITYLQANATTILPSLYSQAVADTGGVSDFQCRLSNAVRAAFRFMRLEPDDHALLIKPFTGDFFSNCMNVVMPSDLCDGFSVVSYQPLLLEATNLVVVNEPVPRVTMRYTMLPAE